MIEILPPLEKYKYDTWKLLPVKCYIDNSVRLWSYIRNVNTNQKHIVHGSLPFKLILEVLSFKYSSKGRSKELVLGL
jgi:hypothetical protein